MQDLRFHSGVAEDSNLPDHIVSFVSRKQLWMLADKADYFPYTQEWHCFVVASHGVTYN
jgi:hypothetical protein